jgi:glycine/D-amino acid oxidase-like deaminating enzyme
MTEPIPTRTVRRTATRALQTIDADICVLGAGISGVAAALEAAKLGSKVVLVDGAPALGGQAVGSIIGTIIGLYSHGPDAYQLTHGMADDLLRDLKAEGSLSRSHRSTVMFQPKVRSRQIRGMDAAGVRRCRASFTDVAFGDGDAAPLRRAAGTVRCGANGYVDSSGDMTIRRRGAQ